MCGVCFKLVLFISLRNIKTHLANMCETIQTEDTRILPVSNIFAHTLLPAAGPYFVYRRKCWDNTFALLDQFMACHVPEHKVFLIDCLLPSFLSMKLNAAEEKKCTYIQFVPLITTCSLTTKDVLIISQITTLNILQRNI